MNLAFVLNLKAEVLKCKNTAAVWLTIVGSAFIPLINVIKCISRPDYFVPKMAADPWKVWIEYNWQIAAAFFLVMYIILITSLVVQIEFRNNAWKQVYATPRSYLDIFLSKVLIIHLLIIGCFVLFNIFIVLTAYLTALIQNQYTFPLHEVPYNNMIVISIKMYCSTWAVLAIQYWLSLKIGNFVVPLGIGLALFTSGFMIRQWEHIDYYPYMYPFLIYFDNPGLSSDIAERAMINSSVWMVLVLVSGYLHVLASREKG
jgi:lantibiotic transport system permease protein